MARKLKIKLNKLKKKIPRRQHVFKYAKTQEEIIRVYRFGPHSCMKGRVSVAAYAKGDLAVAYLTHIKSGRIVARAVVWPKKGLYWRMYGDSKRLQHSLAYRGYRHGRLKGARIDANTFGGHLSIDGCYGTKFSPCGQYRIIM